MTADCLITLSDFNCTEWLVKYNAADAPTTFEEIVMSMITYVISIAYVTHILVISISYVTSSFVSSGSVLDVLCS